MSVDATDAVVVWSDDEPRMSAERGQLYRELEDTFRWLASTPRLWVHDWESRDMQDQRDSEGGGHD